MSQQKENDGDTKASSKTNEPDPNAAVVEEKIIKVTGDVQIRKYYKGRLLGKGGFAKCYEFSCAENKKIFAGKVIAKSSLVKSRAKQKLISEIKIHKSLHHPQIVAFEHYFEDTENVYILLEICQNQTLNDLLKRRKRLTEIEVQCYIVQLIKALKYLHSHRVIHRDLKLGNLFLTDKMELKVGDFGLATKLDFEGERKRTVCGTPNYIAPEILDGKTGHSYEVDIWSLGVIIYTLIIGKPPFETRDVKTTYKRIKMNAYSFPETAIISEAAKNLISQILVTDPAKRPSLDQILIHDFFNQGTSIPKLLPTSTLACTPSLSYIRTFMPDAGKDGIVNKPCTTTKLTDLPSGSNDKKVEQKKSYGDKEEETNDTNKNDPNLKGPDTWVKKWVDYSSKYGLGYLLSNGYSGVFFNDSSKIILNPETKVFFYIERRSPDRQEVIVTHTMDDYPKETLQKKVTLLQHFKNYLEGDNTTSSKNEDKDKEKEETEEKEKEKDKDKEIGEKPFTYVKKWMRTRHAIMFRLSNKIVQVCFQDHTEIILSSESRIVTYVNKKGDRSTYPLSSALENSNYEMTKRLKYTKDILTHMLNMNLQRSSQKKTQDSSSQHDK
jgi:polo-like kinase 1